MGQYEQLRNGGRSHFLTLRIPTCDQSFQHRSNSILDSLIETRYRIIDDDNGSTTISDINLYHLDEVNKGYGSLLPFAQTRCGSTVSRNKIVVPLNLKAELFTTKQVSDSSIQ